MTRTIFGALVAVVAVGCTGSTAQSRSVSDQELADAKQKQIQDVESRTDLTPEQKAGLMNHYGAGPGRPGSGPQGGPPQGQ